MSIDMAQFHQVFFEESFEGLDIMETGLLDMDPGTVDSDTINRIFRAAHSIKGGAGTFGFMHISEFTHIMETLLDEQRDGRRDVTQEAINTLLASVDVLRDMLSAAQDGGEYDEERAKTQRADLERILANKGVSPAVLVTPTAESVAPVTAPAVIEIPVIEPIGWKIVFSPHPHLLRSGNDPLRIIRELASLGDLKVSCDTERLPRFADMEPEDSFLSWDLRLMGEIKQSAIDDVFAWVEDDCDFAVMPIMPEGAQEAIEKAVAAQQAAQSGQVVEAAETEAVPTAAKAKTKPVEAKASGSTSIRVDTVKIDSLINMVGELVITQSMLGLLGEDFQMDNVGRLQEGLCQLERHTRELQESVMKIRMLPISFTFSRFPRLVHDMSAKLEKKIDLVLLGEATEVDKTVIEKISDPLVHLVRNSLDHGIEQPAARVAAGKDETGTITLSAEHKGGNVVLQIRDDGKGLDRDRIYTKALEKGLITEDDDLSDQQIYELIFQPGFSTAEVVTDVSGRGVGMDVVRRNINELGGGIEIDSTLGQGSLITIRLPLTLAILDGQSIRVGDEVYIIPLITIVESIQIKPIMINMVAGRGETFKLREKYLPIIRLHEVFGISSPKTTDLTEGIMVVVETEQGHCGLFVDELMGQQQVVIKSLKTNFHAVDGISGATILGDGSVALILDIQGLVELHKGFNDQKDISKLEMSA